MIAFEQPWFDRIKLDMREAGRDKIGVHVWKSGHSCQFFTIHVDTLRDPEFPLWSYLHDQASERWAHEHELVTDTCPTCGSQLKDSQRMYEGRRFCVNCGSALEGDNHV
jgi:hypothetical protein